MRNFGGNVACADGVLLVDHRFAQAGIRPHIHVAKVREDEVVVVITQESAGGNETILRIGVGLDMQPYCCPRDGIR